MSCIVQHKNTCLERHVIMNSWLLDRTIESNIGIFFGHSRIIIQNEFKSHNFSKKISMDMNRATAFSSPLSTFHFSAAAVNFFLFFSLFFLVLLLLLLLFVREKKFVIKHIVSVMRSSTMRFLFNLYHINEEKRSAEIIFSSWISSNKNQIADLGRMFVFVWRRLWFSTRTFNNLKHDSVTIVIAMDFHDLWLRIFHWRTIWAVCSVCGLNIRFCLIDFQLQSSFHNTYQGKASLI